MWKYKSAEAKEDQIIVTLVEDSDPENLQEEKLTWSPGEGQTKKEFRRMVKQEVKHILKHRNRIVKGTEVTEDLLPDVPSEMIFKPRKERLKPNKPREKK